MSPVRLLRIALAVMIGMLITGAVAGTAHAWTQGYRLLSVQSDSMQPVFGRGDAVLLQRRDASALVPGDVVTFGAAGATGTPISHRVLAARPGGLITKGDSLREQDQPVAFSRVQGRVIAVLPGFGKALEFMRSPVGLALLVYLPALLLIAVEIRRLLTHSSRPMYTFRAR